LQRWKIEEKGRPDRRFCDCGRAITSPCRKLVADFFYSANAVPDAGQLPGVGIAASLPARHEVLRQNRTRKPAAAQQHGSRFNVRHYTTVM